jgi:hypothetical protein
MYSPHARDALCEAYRRGFHYPKYVIITFGWYVRQWWEMDAPSTNCTAEERAHVLLYSMAAVSSQFPREQDEYTAEPNIVRVFHSWNFMCVYFQSFCYARQSHRY